MTEVNKKYLLIGALVLLTIITIYIICLSAYNNMQENAFSVNDYKVTYYTVNKGDTLWEIGQEYKLEKDDVRDWIGEVKKLNMTNSVNLVAGTCIKIYVAK